MLAATPAVPVACHRAKVLRGKGRGFVGIAPVRPVRKSKATASKSLLVVITLK